MKFIIKVIKPFVFWILGLFFVTICVAISASLKPFALKKLLNYLALLDIQSNSIDILKPAIFYLLASLFPVIVFRLHNFIWVNLLPPLRRRIAELTMHDIQLHPYAFFQNHPSANISNKIKELINAIPDLIKIIFDDFFCGFLTLIIALATVWSVNYKFSIGLLAWFVIYFVGSTAILKHAKNVGKEGIQLRSKVLAKIVETLENIKCIRLLCKEKFEEEKLGLILTECQLVDRKKELYTVRTFAFQGYTFVLYQGLCLFWLISDYKTAELTLGDFALILSINHFFVDYFRKISKTFVDFADFLGNIQQGLEIVKLPKKPEKLNCGEIVTITRGEIIFRNVSFQYEGYPPLFRNQSLHIRTTEKVAIVGHSGSGKSTFVDLILRLYDVSSGAIIIDGKNIADVSAHSLRSAFSVVPQTPSLFYGNLLENIRYGKTDATDEEVIEAAKIAEIHEFISKLPRGYDSPIDSMGRKLSAGQRQRIAIARAVLKNAPILILDEAMSHLDTITENRIQTTLSRLMQDKTTIIITHRPSLVLLSVDKILVFDQGKIIESGTHYELLEKGENYQKLWKDVEKFANNLTSPIMSPEILPL